jgi:hypothetical protein
MPTSPRDCPSPFLDPSFYKKPEETTQEFLKMKTKKNTKLQKKMKKKKKCKKIVKKILHKKKILV